MCILAEDETDACNVILEDMAVKRMVDITATKLVADMEKDKAKSTKFSDIIKIIVGKEYTLVIDIHKDNILSDSNIYYASDICDFKSTNEVSNSNFTKVEDSSLNMLSRQVLCIYSSIFHMLYNNYIYDFIINHFRQLYLHMRLTLPGLQNRQVRVGRDLRLQMTWHMRC